MIDNPSLEQLEASAKTLLALINKIKALDSVGAIDKDLLLNETQKLYGQLLIWKPKDRIKANETKEDQPVEEPIQEQETPEEPISVELKPELRETAVAEEEKIEEVHKENFEPFIEPQPEEIIPDEITEESSMESGHEREPVEEPAAPTSEVTAKESKPEIEKTKEIKQKVPLQESKTTLDLFSDTPKDSLGTTFTREKHPSVGEVLKKPIGDLREAIGINDKFLFINELFNGDMSRYNKVLDELNEFSSISGAQTYLSELSVQYNWRKDHTAYHRFEEILQKKYN